MKTLKSEEVFVIRQEANFDKACDEAYDKAISILKIDEDGHSSIPIWHRSSCFVIVSFQEYLHTGSMGSHEHKYIFLVEAIMNEEDD
jgi:hypothetical protein